MQKTFHNICSRGNRTRNYIAAPMRHTTKKYPENFLGEAVHLAQTADARTTSNSHHWHKAASKLTPQTSQTSFSSSKIETSQALLGNYQVAGAKLAAVRSGDPPTCASLKSRFLRLFKSGLNAGGNTSQSKLNKGSNTISNSSLKDTDDIDLECADLVKQMKQVNDVL